MTIRNCTNPSPDDQAPAYLNRIDVELQLIFCLPIDSMRMKIYFRFSMSRPIKSPWPRSKYFRIACKCSSNLCGPITISSTFFDVFKYTLWIMICSLVSGTSANILSTEIEEILAVTNSAQCPLTTASAFSRTNHLFPDIPSVLFSL